MSDENKDIGIDIIEKNDEYKEWLHYAQMDLDSAKYLNGAPMHPKPIHVVCYHSQQAAEKAAKALIVYYGCQGGGLPKKHDVEFLLRQVKNLLKEDKGFAIPDDIMVRAARISRYGSEIRYPQEIQVGEHDAVKALEDGETILHWVKGCLESPRQTIKKE